MIYLRPSAQLGPPCRDTSKPDNRLSRLGRLFLGVGSLADVHARMPRVTIRIEN